LITNNGKILIFSSYTICIEITRLVSRIDKAIISKISHVTPKCNLSHFVDVWRAENPRVDLDIDGLAPGPPTSTAACS